MDLTIRGGMGGKETISRLLELDPNARAIVSSGYSNDPVMANYKDYGFLGMVPKPYAIRALLDEVHKVMGTQFNTLKSNNPKQGNGVENEVSI